MISRVNRIVWTGRWAVDRLLVFPVVVHGGNGAESVASLGILSSVTDPAEASEASFGVALPEDDACYQKGRQSETSCKSAPMDLKDLDSFRPRVVGVGPGSHDDFFAVVWAHVGTWWLRLLS